MATTQGSVDSLDEAFIIQQPISERRKRRLLNDYLGERRRTRITETLFDRVGALEKKHRPSPGPAPEDARVFGFRAIVFKHSFIEGVDSLIVSAHAWAIGEEDFLLQHLEENLRHAVDGHLGVDVERHPTAISSALRILGAFEGMAADLRARGYSPSAFFVAGSLGQPLYEALQGKTQNPWDWYSRPGPDLRPTHRFIGAHQGTPIVAIGVSLVPSLYAVDIGRFATLTRYGIGPDFEPEFEVKEFTQEEARKVLARQPRLILDPPPGSGQDAERVRQLQLRVGLELWETYKLDLKDPGAVIARPLAEPIFD